MSLMYCLIKCEVYQLNIYFNDKRFIKEPTVIENRTKVVGIATGLRHTLYLTTGNNIYSCGSNDFGQLGQDKSQCRPSSIDELECVQVSQIYAGDYYSLALSVDGQIHGWGRSDRGELLCSTEIIPKPRLLTSLINYKIVQVACGACHVVALDQSGNMLVWGDNEYGQLGLGQCSAKQVIQDGYSSNL